MSRNLAGIDAGPSTVETKFTVKTRILVPTMNMRYEEMEVFTLALDSFVAHF
jgi:hypothetical protein